jgi:sugar/nucleoside kinase (ribokinase family)
MSKLAVPDYQLDLADIDTRPLPYEQAEPEEESIEVVEAVVAGHICLDIIPTLVGDALVFAPGRLIEAGKAILATGGPVSNTGLALHKLGITTRLMGKVGDDLFGQAILSVIEYYEPGLAGGMIIAQREASSYSVIISPPGVDRTFIHAPGCNDTFGADDIRYDLLKIVRLFHFGYPPLMARMYRDDGAELASIFRQAKACGVTTSLDLSMPDPSRPAGHADWRTILAATLPSVDVFLPSVEELLFMLRRPLFDQLTARAGEAGLVDYVSPAIVSELGQTLLNMGAKIVGLKVGHRGLYLRTSDAAALADIGRGQPTKLKAWANRELWAPCFATSVVGTTGSGDATVAGFLLGLLRGMTPEATLSAACAVGACNVEAADAISGIRSWPETMERIATGWPRLMLEKKGLPSLDMQAFGWQWDEVSEVWVGPGL